MNAALIQFWQRLFPPRPEYAEPKFATINLRFGDQPESCLVMYVSAKGKGVLEVNSPQFSTRRTMWHGDELDVQVIVKDFTFNLQKGEQR